MLRAREAAGSGYGMAHSLNTFYAEAVATPTELSCLSTEPALAMHTSALVDKRWGVAHDTSRGSNALKLVDKALEQGLGSSNSISPRAAYYGYDSRPIEAGRARRHIVEGPLYSALAIACKYGMAIVANVRGRGFVQLCP